MKNLMFYCIYTTPNKGTNFIGFYETTMAPHWIGGDGIIKLNSFIEDNKICVVPSVEFKSYTSFIPMGSNPIFMGFYNSENGLDELKKAFADNVLVGALDILDATFIVRASDESNKEKLNEGIKRVESDIEEANVELYTLSELIDDLKNGLSKCNDEDRKLLNVNIAELTTSYNEIKEYYEEGLKLELERLKQKQKTS